jgi:RHS repeat-associated protein
VYDKASGNLLITFSQNVSTEGKDKWEELNIGLTAKEAVQVEISCENASNISVFFDNLEIKMQAVPTAIVVQENHYYPFGLGMKGLDWTLTPTKENKYQYNGGVEKNTDFDLNLYETDFRPYDPQIGRLTGVDALAEVFPSLTPYNFAFNDPINFNDPTGLCPECEKHFEGKTILDGTTHYANGAEYIYEGGNWTRVGGVMAEITVTSESHYGTDLSTSSEVSTWSGWVNAGSGYVENYLPNNANAMGKSLMNAGPISFLSPSGKTIYDATNNPELAQKWSKVGLERNLATWYQKFGGQLTQMGKVIKHTGIIGGWTTALLSTGIDFGQTVAYAMAGHTKAAGDKATNTLVNGTFTGIGLFGGPVGWGVSTVYFMGTQIGSDKSAYGIWGIIGQDMSKDFNKSMNIINNQNFSSAFSMDK